MPDDSRRSVVCSHCAASGRVRVDNEQTHFTCGECGERTTKKLGLALAKSAATQRSDQEAASDAAQRKTFLRVLGVIVGLAFLAFGTYGQLHGCSRNEPPKPSYVVVTP